MMLKLADYMYNNFDEVPMTIAHSKGMIEGTTDHVMEICIISREAADDYYLLQNRTEFVDCPFCKGKGTYINYERVNMYEDDYVTHKCEACGGTGKKIILK